MPGFASRRVVRCEEMALRQPAMRHIRMLLPKLPITGSLRVLGLPRIACKPQGLHAFQTGATKRALTLKRTRAGTIAPLATSAEQRLTSNSWRSKSDVRCGRADSPWSDEEPRTASVPRDAQEPSDIMSLTSERSAWWLARRAQQVSSHRCTESRSVRAAARAWWPRTRECTVY